jgi:hypothetical protein
MTYDAEFFEMTAEPSLVAAKLILPRILQETKARTVIDVGCGVGAWASVAKEHGCTTLAIDGFAAESDVLVAEFDRRDLTEGIDCSGYDLAICLEVAEHLPEDCAEQLIEGLCGAQYILFSAAIPDQRGVDHVNEQWPSWWAGLFKKHEHYGTNDIRWRHWGNDQIEGYYRQNLIVFAKPLDLARADYRQGLFDIVHPHLWEYFHR